MKETLTSKSKWMALALSLSVATGITAGCSGEKTTIEQKAEVKHEEKAEPSTAVVQPKMVKESTIKVENAKALITQNGFLNGFPENNLAEFKMVKDNKEILRVFVMGPDIYSYLSKEKKDGKTEFALTYQESKDGITNPILVKIEKKL